MESILQEYDAKLMHKAGSLIGLDEVGRGALAGPVFTAACLVKQDFFLDSKKMSANLREHAFENLMHLKTIGSVDFEIASASVQEIESLNISGATRLSFDRSLKALHERNPSSRQSLILIDGKPLKDFPYVHQAIVGGDDQSLSIACASILAKVARDRFMDAMGDRFPHYNWQKNKGYGTQFHREQIRLVGPSPEHRTLFLRKILNK
ncbi:MAG: ribonuclease HII [Verrucomicrobia bacterium]|nr:ribonuclease HII [Verrucomicrobiota bacterium]